MKTTDHNMIIFNPISKSGRLWRSSAYLKLTWVTSVLKQYLRGSKSPPRTSSKFILIGVHLLFLKYGQQMLTGYFGQYLQNEVFNKTRLQAHYHLYHQILLNKGLLPDWILPPAWWDRPEQYWFDSSQCSWMAIDEIVNRRSTHRQVIWYTATWRYSRQWHYSFQEPLSAMYPWCNRGEDMWTGSWSEICGGKSYGKQQDCTTEITSNQNNGIHPIHLCQHTSFNRYSHLASQWKSGSFKICSWDWVSLKLNHFN